MKKVPFKRLLSLFLVVSLGVTLNGCGSEKYNTTAPYGSIAGNYATNGDTTLTNIQLYDMLRPSGYNEFYNMIEENILSNYVDDENTKIDFMDLNYNDDKDAMHDIIIKAIFGADDMDDMNEILPSDFEDTVEQLIDSLYASNITITKDQIYIDTANNKLVFPESLFDFFKLDLAKENFGNVKLEEIIAKGEEYDEFVKDEDGKLTDETETITNKYYISDEDIENYYDNTYRHQQDYNAVIVGFNTLQEYETAMNSAYYSSGTTYSITNNTAAYYARLYNNAYSYKTQLTYNSSSVANDLINQSSTIVNADKLSSFNSGLASFISNLEAGEYTTTYKEFGGKYYMVYKLNDLADDAWEDLSTETQDALYQDIYDELFESKMTSSFIAGQIDEIITDLIDEEALTINDPIYGLIFGTTYSNYTYEAQTLDDDVNVVTFIYNETDFEISADSLFERLATTYGVATSMQYFTSCAIANSDLIDQLDDDQLDAAQDAFDDEMDSFEANSYSSNGITNVFTEEEFLLMKFGFDNESDVIDNYYIPQQVVNNFSDEYSDFYFDLLSLTGQNNYENYFNLDIKHVLLFVDYDLDGTLDNPEEFMQKLDSTEQANFQNAILSIYENIYAEAEYLSGSLSDNLDKIVRMYNNNDTLAHTTPTTTRTWKYIKEQYGDFNIQIKVESLGTIDNAAAASFVPEFSAHVEAMYRDFYNEAKENVTTSVEDEDYTKDLLSELDDLLDTPKLEEITTYENLCMSSFGYHMLLSTNGKTATSAIFREDQDYKANTEDEYKIYENIIVTYDDEEYTFNGYSDTAWPSMDQLKVFVYESASDDGVESLKASTETIINEFYSTFNTRYSDTTFTNFVFYTMLDVQISFSDTSIDTDMVDNWFVIVQKQLDQYVDTSSNSTHSYAGWWEFVSNYDFSDKSE